MTMEELAQRLEQAEQKIEALEETLETLKKMGASEQMQAYIDTRQRTMQLTGLLNTLSGQSVIDTSEAERQIMQAQHQKESVDRQIREAIASASMVNTNSATPAELFTYENWVSDSYNGVRITGYNGFDEQIIAIPSKINGRDVISIGEKAFLNATMEEVVLPASITDICPSAFENCSNLARIIIPNAVTSIGEKAFSGCRSLNAILLPESLRELGKWCFNNSGITSINFPRRIKAVPDWCCYDCRNLHEVTIAEGVKQIGYGAFALTVRKYGDTNYLRTLVIPKSVDIVENDAIKLRPETHVAFLGLQTTGPKPGRLANIRAIASPKTIFYVIPGSAMQRYAREHNFPMKSLSEFPA